MEDNRFTAEDGTTFFINSEYGRGGREYFIERQEHGELRSVRDGVFDGSIDKRVVLRRLAKRLREHKAEA
jgi:hypothetical protein